jgi:hypothetical protein
MRLLLGCTYGAVNRWVVPSVTQVSGNDPPMNSAAQSDCRHPTSGERMAPLASRRFVETSSLILSMSAWSDAPAFFLLGTVMATVYLVQSSRMAST